CKSDFIAASTSNASSSTWSGSEFTTTRQAANRPLSGQDRRSAGSIPPCRTPYPRVRASDVGEVAVQLLALVFGRVGPAVVVAAQHTGQLPLHTKSATRTTHSSPASPILIATVPP